MDYVLNNIFTENSGARKGFPRVAMVITAGQSQDSVEDYAKKLRNGGVEIFTLGMWESKAVCQTCNAFFSWYRVSVLGQKNFALSILLLGGMVEKKPSSSQRVIRWVLQTLPLAKS